MIWQLLEIISWRSSFALNIDAIMLLMKRGERSNVRHVGFRIAIHKWILKSECELKSNQNK